MNEHESIQVEPIIPPEKYRGAVQQAYEVSLQTYMLMKEAHPDALRKWLIGKFVRIV